MKRIALLSLLVAAAPAAFAQLSADSKPVTVTVLTYVQVNLAQPAPIVVDDGGSRGTYTTSALYTVSCNVPVHAVGRALGTLPAGVATATVSNNNSQPFAPTAFATDTCVITLSGLTFANSKSDDGQSFLANVTVSAD